MAAVLAMMLLAVSPAMADSDYDVESGDVDQTFIVSGTGDNSNQCVGLQGVANTGNALNFGSGTDTNGDGLADLINDLDDDFDLDDDDFLDLLEDVNDHGGGGDFDQDASVDVSPVNVTTCDQAVDQNATVY